VARTNDNSTRYQSRPLPVLPAAALDQLARVHVETSQASRLVLFLRSSVHVASLFMLMGSCVLLLGGGASFARNFCWAVLILIGVGGLLYSSIRNTAAAFDRAPVSEAARDLRVILFYMGLAWGSGAFLAVSADFPAYQAILFAVLPVFLLALMLNDNFGLLAFLAPAGVWTVYAAFARTWPQAPLDAVLIPTLQAGLFLVMLLRHRTHFPAGLALR
jgi:hypothetical protein